MTAKIAIPSAVAAAKLNSPPGPRVAVVFNRFGPYHHARLNAAGRLMQIWGVEACATEDTYAWSKVEGAERFTRVTLTEYDSGNQQWRTELRNKMWRTFDEVKPQVVVVPGWTAPEALIALWWCQANGTPAVVMSESTAWDEPRVFWKEWIKRRLVKLCGAGLAGGKPHAEYLVQLGLPRDRVFLGYDIVDNNYFASKIEECRAQGPTPRERLGLPARYFLASARFVEKKNLLRLVEAYGRYREIAGGSCAWSLVLLGDGPLNESLKARLSALKLRDHVLLPGFIQYEELPAYYAMASAFIHASTTEQWGLVVNESMACGLPVLVSDRCGCARDLVREGVNGFTFDPGNVEEMAQRMRQLSTLNASQLSTMSDASRRIIAQWGPERFGTGLRDAVVAAQSARQPRASMIDRVLLQALLRRRAS